LGLAQFASEAADGDLHGLGERVGVFVPDVAEQVGRAEVGRRDAEECFQHAELLEREVEQAPIAADRAGHGVELNAGDTEAVALGAGFAAGEGPDTEDELRKVEGFDEVVVGAEAETADPIAGLVGGGQHQNHRWLLAFGEQPRQVVAVQAGQIAVEDGDVVGVDVELDGGVEAVVGDVHGHALVA
jgi:hypothetical protein